MEEVGEVEVEEEKKVEVVPPQPEQPGMPTYEQLWNLTQNLLREQQETKKKKIHGAKCNLCGSFPDL